MKIRSKKKNFDSEIDASKMEICPSELKANLQSIDEASFTDNSKASAQKASF